MPMMTRVDFNVDSVFFVSTFSPERPSRLADRLDYTYGHSTLSGEMTEEQKKEAKDKSIKEDPYNLYNSLYLFVK